MNYLLLVYEQAYQPAKKLTSSNIQEEKNYSETLKTFNMLLDTLEPYFIWEYLTENFDIILNQQQDKESITAGSTIEQICGIINMLLDIFSLESSTDIQSEHLSEMLYRLLEIMNNNIERLTPNQITLSHLSIFRHSINHQHQLFDNNLTDSDTEDDNEQTSFAVNEYSTDIYNRLLRTDCTGKLQNPSLISEQQCTKDIKRLLRQMVHKVEKQVYQFSSEKRNRLTTTTTTRTLESKHYIEKLIKLYKIFFHRFIITYFIDKNQILLNEKFQSIYSIIKNKTNDNLLTIFNRYQQLNELKLKLNENVDHYKIPFEDCCKLLIELCCFPRQSSINDQSISSKGIN
jgi:hypothetical protein